MKKIIFGLIGIFFLASQAMSQNADDLATQNIFSVQFGKKWLSDEYLSTLPYSGLALNITNEWWKYFNLENSTWLHSGDLCLSGALLYNPAYSNSIIGFGLNGGWGAYYNFQIVKNFAFLGGGFANIDFYGKYTGRSVNKPFSMDLSTNLNLSAGISYTFNGRKTHYRLRYLIRTPFLGCMFVPEMGESYYEILSTLKGNVHATSFHNKLGLKHGLTLDMRFRSSTWRIGLEHEFLKYHANELHFNREQLSLVIGTVLDGRSYGGHNKPDMFKAVW